MATLSYYRRQVEILTQRLYKDHLTTRVLQGKRFIDTHYATSISLDQVAREAWLSKFHFIRLFKSYYGITPHQYLIDVRIQHAKRLLNHRKLDSVCESVGFVSTSSFIALFKKSTGFTPAAFQKKQFSRATY